MDFNNLNYQNNNAMFQNPMMNNPYNMMMQNPMNNQPSNIMIQNSMNNGTYNMMIQNPMNYPNNIFIPIQTSNQFNGINPYQMNYQNNIYLPNQINMNNLPFNGMIQNQINFQTPKLYNEINQPIKKINYINNDIKENIPIKNSIKLDIDNNNLKELYLYPKIDFTEEELKNSKVLLVIGQTGQGKTTFINALVNIYLGISFNR
jgi:flagellar biosynthesis GTPase FlhF